MRGTWTNRALVQLTLVRIREFVREPEALFWTLLFPVLLAAGLGIAFRNRPTEVLKIAAVTPQLAEPCGRSPPSTSGSCPPPRPTSRCERDRSR